MIAIIGDIHGCFYTLKELVNQIRIKYPGIPLFAVGDLVDRGNYSYEVLNFVISQNIRFTPGNHDFMFYYFIKEPASVIGRAWLYNGSEATIKSYNNRMQYITDHLDAIYNAPLFINHTDCFISHAGISSFYKKKVSSFLPGNEDSLDNLLRSEISSEHGVLWTRDDLMDIGKLQIVGHTRQEEITHNKTSNTLYIDTSVYTGNKLSAVIIDDNKILDKFSVSTLNVDIKNNNL
jgi:serine/threonine protein phosphatase 1